MKARLTALLTILSLALLAAACGEGYSPKDTGPADVPAEVPADLPDVPGDVPDVPADLPMDVPGDVPADVPDVPGDVPADVPADPGYGPDNLPDVPFAPPACGSGTYDWKGLIPGPGEAGYDAELAKKADAFDRVWSAFNAGAMHLNTDVTVALDRVEIRQKIADFAADPAAWDFAAFAGVEAMDAVTSVHKVAGLYGGDGVAADAYRYMVLRDQGAPCADVARAREWLLGDLDMLHTVVDITGAPGVIVRGIARTDLPGDGPSVTTVPLRDEEGNPLPLVKNNGTWRQDFSGNYPDLVWEDSVSRDMYIGWVVAYAAAWEAIRNDPDVPEATKDRLQADALAVARQLMVVRESGYDLEVPDADGRTTLHGWLNEHNFDGIFYSDDIRNGFHAMMAIGIAAAWAFVTEDPEVKAWLYDGLIAERRIHEIARDELYLVDMGYVSNYSNYNMAFQGAWLAMRYLADPGAREAVRVGIRDGMYDRPGQDRQPADFGYSLYDFVFAQGQADASAWWPARQPFDAGAVARGTQTLKEFAPAPYWNLGIEQCPAAVCTDDDPKVDEPDCTALDGTTHLTVLGCVGRNGDLITLEPVPMRLRGPSNFHWRSNPFQPNRDGDGSALLPGVDFRVAYWMGRHFRAAQ